LGCLLLWPALRWLPRPEAAPSGASAALMADRPPGSRFLRLLMASYFCAGIGYVVSTTFIVAIVDALPGLQGRGTWVFMVMGLAAAPSCMLWDLIARRTGDVLALVLAALLQIVGIVLPVWPGGFAAALLGSVLFGSTFVGMVSLVLTMAGRYYPSHPAKMMGRMTLSYGCAQIIGPALTAWLAQQFGSYGAGLYMAAAVMAVGAALLVAMLGLAPTKGQTSTVNELPGGLSKSANRN
ncbi:MAG: YbfB/YjiJ family MFS transporter, partial [Paucibacter sp.]|nr:YbfB/YjiJ family MFS transporter [Roseateles sp.]